MLDFSFTIYLFTDFITHIEIKKLNLINLCKYFNYYLSDIKAELFLIENQHSTSDGYENYKLILVNIYIFI